MCDGRRVEEKIIRTNDAERLVSASRLVEKYLDVSMKYARAFGFVCCSVLIAGSVWPEHGFDYRRP